MRLNYLAGFLISLLPCFSFADVEWNASLGVEKAFTDNARLTESNERSDSSNSINASLTVSANERDYRLAANYAFQTQSWQHDTFDTDSQLEGNLLADFLLVPGRLQWMVAHNQSVARTESQLPNTPDNREERNVVSTGPTIRQRLSSRSELSLRSTYSSVDLEESSRNDSDRFANSLSINYLTKFRATTSITASNEKVLFDANKNLNYQRDTVYIGLSGSQSLFDYNFGIGGNRINPKIGKEQSGGYVNLEFSKSFGRDIFSLELNKELTDSVFGSDQIDTDVEFSDTLTSLGEVEIIERESAYISYSKDVIPDRFYVNLNAGYETEKSREGDNIDRERKNLSVNCSYGLTMQLSLGCEFEFAEDLFHSELPARKDETQSYTIGLAYLYDANLNTRFDVVYRDLSSDLDGFGYEEWLAIIRVDYLFGIR